MGLNAKILLLALVINLVLFAFQQSTPEERCATGAKYVCKNCFNFANCVNNGDGTYSLGTTVVPCPTTPKLAYCDDSLFSTSSSYGQCSPIPAKTTKCGCSSTTTCIADPNNASIVLHCENSPATSDAPCSVPAIDLNACSCLTCSDTCPLVDDPNDDCSMYYLCYRGNLLPDNCSEPLCFNQDQCQCVVPTTTVTSTTGPTTTDQSTSESSTPKFSTILTTTSATSASGTSSSKTTATGTTATGTTATGTTATGTTATGTTGTKTTATGTNATETTATGTTATGTTATETTGTRTTGTGTTATGTTSTGTTVTGTTGTGTTSTGTTATGTTAIKTTGTGTTATGTTATETGTGTTGTGTTNTKTAGTETTATGTTATGTTATGKTGTGTTATGTTGTGTTVTGTTAIGTTATGTTATGTTGTVTTKIPSTTSSISGGSSTTTSLPITCPPGDCTFVDNPDDDCEKYYYCYGGMVFDQTCPTGLCFNQNACQCIADTTLAPTTLESTTVLPSCSADCPFVDNLDDDCLKYFFCYDDEVIPYVCPSGLCFDQTQCGCVESDASTSTSYSTFILTTLESTTVLVTESTTKPTTGSTAGPTTESYPEPTTKPTTGPTIRPKTESTTEPIIISTFESTALPPITTTTTTQGTPTCSDGCPYVDDPNSDDCAKIFYCDNGSLVDYTCPGTGLCFDQANCECS